ncbi:MAG: hypothetical protein R8P61_24790 [Bacteroidia bacterium]|nr:hypothetical protein [Bacteroidia bacterium]
MSKLHEFYKKHIDFLIGRNTILFFAIIAHVILLRSFLVPDPFHLKLSLFCFHEDSHETPIPMHFQVSSTIWKSELIVFEESPFPRDKLRRKIRSKKYPLSLYKATQIYHLTQQRFPIKPGFEECERSEWIEVEFRYGTAEGIHEIISIGCGKEGWKYINALADWIKIDS